MYIPLILLAFASTATAQSAACDQVCEGVLSASTDWLLSQLPKADVRRRIIFGTGNERLLRDQEYTPEIIAQTRAIEEIGKRLGIPAKPREEEEGWKICRADQARASCGTAAGTTFITLKNVLILSAVEARVDYEINTVRAPSPIPRTHWFSTEVGRLHLTRTGSGWRVSPVGLKAVS